MSLEVFASCAPHQPDIARGPDEQQSAVVIAAHQP
jgi:hypothetical protein